MLLTLAIPTYNRAHLLEQRLQEILPQMRDEVEILVCNDGSTDGTEAVCEKFREKGIRICHNPINMGLSRNMLLAFEQARGQWLWTLGDDDSLRPDALERAVELIGKYPDAGVIAFSSDTLDFTEPSRFDSLQGFLAEHGITDISFMSANLYNLAKAQKHLKVFSQASITLAPHVPLVLRLLEAQTGALQYDPVEVLGPCEANRRWSSLESALGYCLVPEFVRDPHLQKLAALSAWNQTRWMHRYGLREVHDGASFARWKRMCRTANALLESYGVSVGSLLGDKRRNPKVLIEGLVVFLLQHSPFFILQSSIRKMRERRLGDKVLLDN